MATYEALCNQLNDLIHLDNDAIEAYESAISRLDDPTYRARLQEYCDDHRTHVTHLQRLVQSLGGVPATGADAMRVLTQGKVVIMSISGDSGILKAMRANEEVTNTKYEEALKRTDLTPEVRQLLTKHLSDERRHRQWLIETIDGHSSRDASRSSHASAGTNGASDSVHARDGRQHGTDSGVSGYAGNVSGRVGNQNAHLDALPDDPALRTGNGGSSRSALGGNGIGDSSVRSTSTGSGSRTVAALFADRVRAERAVNGLSTVGFSRDRISVLSHNDVHGDARRMRDPAHDHDDGVSAGEGAAAGAAGGAVGGILAALGLAAIPGVGWILAAGPIGAILASGAIGGAIGAAGGGLTGAMTDNGVSERDANIYAEAIRRGGTLVLLSVPEARADQAVQELRRHDPVDLDKTVERWDSSGWKGYDPKSEPYRGELLAQERNHYAAMSRSGNTTQTRFVRTYDQPRAHH